MAHSTAQQSGGQTSPAEQLTKNKSQEKIELFSCLFNLKSQFRDWVFYERSRLNNV
jgi:hypothetical protein